METRQFQHDLSLGRGCGRGNPTRGKALLAGLCVLSVLATLGLATLAEAASAGKTYIQVRISKVMISDDMDANGNGEIRYVLVGSTGNRGHEAIATQTTTFPFEKWYEADEAGANASIMGTGQQSMPVFNFPEDEMGDSLVLALAVLDDDSSPGSVLIVHDIARAVGVAIATAYTGPAGGAIVKVASDKVHEQLQKVDADEVGIVSLAHGRADRFGTGESGNYTNDAQSPNGRVTITYNIRRTRVLEEHKGWCASVTLKKVKVIGDGDPWPKGEGEVYIRARVADGYSNGGNASILHQKTTALPSSGGTKSVDEGRSFPLPADGVILYESKSGGKCAGLPPFLFVEVDVLEDDDESDVDILGVLPIMLSNGWMKEHANRTTPVTYRVRGTDSDEKVEITLEIAIWNPDTSVQ